MEIGGRRGAVAPFALWFVAAEGVGAPSVKTVDKEDSMLRTTTASLIALATAILPAGAQTVLYGEQPVARPAFPPPQPYYAPPPQQVPLQTQPLYYESVPAVQPPPVVFEPEPDARRFRPVPPQALPQQGITQTRPLGPVEQYQPPSGAIFVPPAPPASQFAPSEPQPVPQAAPRPPVPPQPALRAEPAAPEITESEALRDFSDELARIVSLGERYRAASPGFLEDLKELAERYRAMPVDPDGAEEREPEQAEFVGPPPPAGAPAAGTPPADPPEIDEPVEDAEDETPGETEMAMMPEPEPQPVPVPLPLTASDAPMDLIPDGVVEAVPAPVELPQALPPTSAATVYLRDDFMDGDYLSNPAWNVRQGQFTVDPAFGLRPFAPEMVEPAQVTPQVLLQYLIGDGKPEVQEAAGDSGASLIEAQTDIGNAFSLVTTITDHGGEGAAHFIMHQGGANWLGYRLEVRAGPMPLVVLARRGSSGYKDIMKVEAPGFTTGKPHQLRWARLADGQMFVLIDGRPIITARDTVFRQGWKGFAYFTAEADISMRNIRIAEPVER